MNKEYILFPGFKRRALTLSYDDGVRQDKRLISIMRKYGLKGTFNINSALFADKRSDVEKGRMTLEEALELYSDDITEIAAHGARHLSLNAVPAAIAVNDVIEDRKNLEKIFGRIITGMAYAFGTYNDEVVNILRECGMSYCRNTVSTKSFKLPDDPLRLTATCHHNAPELMELAEKFLEESPNARVRSLAKLFYLWGHSYEFDDNDNWDVIENFAKLMGGRDDIWYATNGDIVAYVKAYDSLVFSVDMTKVYNPSAIDVYIQQDRGEREYMIPAGKTIDLV